jgi:hypothetical protein
MISTIFVFGAIALTTGSLTATANNDLPPATHKQVECPACHALRADIASQDDSSVDLTGRCRDCHTEQASQSTTDNLGFHDRLDKGCPDCHSFHDPTIIRAAGQSFRMEFENRGFRFACEACHNTKGSLAGLSEGHRQAAALYHSDLPLLASMSPSDRCLICHSKQSTPLPIPETVLDPPRFSEHTSHPNGIPVQAGQYTSGGRIRTQVDSSVVLNDGKIECQTCHCLTNSNEDFTVSDESGSGPNCMGCHRDNTN